jgi:hypothetical protein
MFVRTNPCIAIFEPFAAVSNTHVLYVLACRCPVRSLFSLAIGSRRLCIVYVVLLLPCFFVSRSTFEQNLCSLLFA